jgi:hypothetical protein
MSITALCFLGLTIAFSLFLVYEPFTQGVVASMGMVLLFTLGLNKKIGSNGSYRIIGEAIFIMPLVAII